MKFVLPETVIMSHSLHQCCESAHACGVQGGIYIGASGAMAPGPEVPGAPFKSNEKKNLAKLIQLDMNRPYRHTLGLRALAPL